MSKITFTISPINPVNFTVKPTSINVSIKANPPVVFTVNSLGKQGIQGPQGLTAGVIQYIAGESLNSHMPIVLVGGLAYKMNHLDPLHQFAFLGFSKTSALPGGSVTVEYNKIELSGWGLVPNQTYIAGVNGGLITVNNTLNSFTKIVGFAQSATVMLIVKDFSSINKN